MLLEVHPISYSTGVMSSACSSNVLVRWEIVFLVIIMDTCTSTKFYVWTESELTSVITDRQLQPHTMMLCTARTLLHRKCFPLLWKLLIYLKNAKLLTQTILTAKPEFKQQYLAPIRSLSETEQCVLLQWVTNGEGSSRGFEYCQLVIT